MKIVNMASKWWKSMWVL